MHFSLIGLAQVVGLIKYAERCFVRPDMPWMEVFTPVLFILASELVLSFMIGVARGFKNKQKAKDDVDTTSPPKVDRTLSTGIRL